MQGLGDRTLRQSRCQIRVWGVGFRVSGLGFWVFVLQLRKGSGARGIRVQGLRRSSFYGTTFRNSSLFICWKDQMCSKGWAIHLPQP